MDGFEALEVRTLADRALDRIESAIMKGDLAPGTKISEVLLAKTFGISRGPLREAIRRLQGRGVCARAAQPRRGAQSRRSLLPGAGRLRLPLPDRARREEPTDRRVAVRRDVSPHPHLSLSIGRPPGPRAPGIRRAPQDPRRAAGARRRARGKAHAGAHPPGPDALGAGTTLTDGHAP